MRGRMLGMLVSVAGSVAVFLAIVLGAAAIGALVGQLVWGQWFLGALLAGCVAALFALPAMPSAGWNPSQPFVPPVERRRDTDHH